MTPEQRYELIDRKLQGVTETLQIVADMQRDNERRFAENSKRFAEDEKRFAENEKRSAETDRRLDLLVRAIEAEHESIKSLERIAVAHEQRLDDIEGH